MANARHDDNHAPTLLVTSKNDGTTLVPVEIDPSTNSIVVSDGTTGSDFGPATPSRDDSHVVVAFGLSVADGVTLIPIYGDPATGAMLIQST